MHFPGYMNGYLDFFFFFFFFLTIGFGLFLTILVGFLHLPKNYVVF